MPEFTPVRSLVDVFNLDPMEVYFGFQAGLEDAPEPGSWASRAYIHGWRNGRVQGGHVPRDAAQEVVYYQHLVATGFSETPANH